MKKKTNQKKVDRSILDACTKDFVERMERIIGKQIIMHDVVHDETDVYHKSSGLVNIPATDPMKSAAMKLDIEESTASITMHYEDHVARSECVAAVFYLDEGVIDICRKWDARRAFSAKYCRKDIRRDWLNFLSLFDEDGHFAYRSDWEDHMRDLITAMNHHMKELIADYNYMQYAFPFDVLGKFDTYDTIISEIKNSRYGNTEWALKHGLDDILEVTNAVDNGKISGTYGLITRMPGFYDKFMYCGKAIYVFENEDEERIDYTLMDKGEINVDIDEFTLDTFKWMIKEIDSKIALRFRDDGDIAGCMTKDDAMKVFHNKYPFIDFDVLLYATVHATLIYKITELQKHCAIPIVLPGITSFYEINMKAVYDATEESFIDWVFPTMTEVMSMNMRMEKPKPTLDKLKTFIDINPRLVSHMISNDWIDCDNPKAEMLKLNQRWIVMNSHYGMMVTDDEDGI